MTFLVGVASVGMVTALAAAGRTDDALRGFREVIDYFATAGNWSHLWATLRNLADLLRCLGDGDTADLIHAAADRAADAPAPRPGTRPGTGAAPVESRGGQGPGPRRDPWRNRAQVRLSDPGQGQWVRSRKASGAGLSRMSASSSLT